jgi:hypothetical protein
MRLRNFLPECFFGKALQLPVVVIRQRMDQIADALEKSCPVAPQSIDGKSFAPL